MDNDIRDMIEKCKGCALATKAPPTTFKPWPKTEQPRSRIHVDFAGPLEDFYYLIVVAWGSQMQKTYNRDDYCIPTWTVCVVRCSRLCGQRQRKAIHISRIQEVQRNLPNKAHNHTAISPKIKRPGWTFCRHVKANPQKSIRYPDGQGSTALSAGIQNHT